jgi:hypothetical protein
LACLANIQNFQGLQESFAAFGGEGIQQLGDARLCQLLLVLLQPQYDMWVRLKRRGPPKWPQYVYNDN